MKWSPEFFIENRSELVLFTNRFSPQKINTKAGSIVIIRRVSDIRSHNTSPKSHPNTKPTTATAKPRSRYVQIHF